MKKIAKILAKEAKKKGICDEWYQALRRLEDKRTMIKMYVRGIDFCLANDFPSNDYIRANFKGMMEEEGVFLDEEIDLANPRRCIALGSTRGKVEVGSYGVCEVFAKHDSALTIIARDNAFIEMDVFDSAKISVRALDKAKVHINRFDGGNITTEKEDEAVIKIVEKHKKTY